MRSFFRRSSPPAPPSTLLPPPKPTHPSTAPLTLIELFQSQGCNSCPPTNANLLSLTDADTNTNTNTLLLTYHVTYWDCLGWTDAFAQHSSDARQRAYVRRLGLRNAFTPQVVVNGRVSGVGNTAAGLEKLVREGAAAATVEGPRVGIEVGIDGDGKARVGVSDVGRGGRLEVWLVGYDARVAEVHVRAGENAGRVLPHRNVVKALSRIGEVDGGGAAEWGVETGGLQAGLDWVVIVQLGAGGPVLGARGLDLGRERV